MGLWILLIDNNVGQAFSSLGVNLWRRHLQVSRGALIWLVGGYLVILAGYMSRGDGLADLSMAAAVYQI